MRLRRFSTSAGRIHWAGSSLVCSRNASAGYRHPFEQGFDLRLVPEKLDQPLHWRRPRKIFVNSMSDLFHLGHRWWRERSARKADAPRLVVNIRRQCRAQRVPSFFKPWAARANTRPAARSTAAPAMSFRSQKHRHAEKLREELTLVRMGTQRIWMNSTWRASWRLQSAFCRAPPTCGCRRHSNSGSGSNSCSFPKESPSTETALLEPP